jgi:uncharacterized protein (DUF58 family)
MCRRIEGRTSLAGLIILLTGSLVCIGGPGTFVLATQDEPRPSEMIRLSARAYSENVRSGEPIVIKLTLRNRSSSTVYLADSYPERDYRFQVKNETGADVALTKKGERLIKYASIYKNTRIAVAPGTTVRNTVIISDLYDMSKRGVYFIVVTREVYDPNKKVPMTPTSAPIRVTVN